MHLFKYVWKLSLLVRLRHSLCDITILKRIMQHKLYSIQCSPFLCLQTTRFFVGCSSCLLQVIRNIQPPFQQISIFACMYTPLPVFVKNCYLYESYNMTHIIWESYYMHPYAGSDTLESVSLATLYIFNCTLYR